MSRLAQRQNAVACGDVRPGRGRRLRELDLGRRRHFRCRPRLAVGARAARERPSRGQRLPLRCTCRGRGVLALCLAAPFLYDQVMATAARGGGSPMALRPTTSWANAFRRSCAAFSTCRPSGWLSAGGRIPGDLSDRRRSMLMHARWHRAIWSRAKAGRPSRLRHSRVREPGGLLAVGQHDRQQRSRMARRCCPALMVLTVFAAVGLVRAGSTDEPSIPAAVALVAARARICRRHQSPARKRGRQPANPGGRSPRRRRCGRRCDGIRPPTSASPTIRFSRRHDAVAGQYLLGAAVEPPFMLCRRAAGAGLHAAAAASAGEEIDAQFIRVFSRRGLARRSSRLATRYDCASSW